MCQWRSWTEPLIRVSQGRQAVNMEDFWSLKLNGGGKTAPYLYTSNAFVDLLCRCRICCDPLRFSRIANTQNNSRVFYF